MPRLPSRQPAQAAPAHQIARYSSVDRRSRRADAVGQRAILIHGVSLSSRGSGRLDTRLDTPPISFRHHPVSRIAPWNAGPRQLQERGCPRSSMIFAYHRRAARRASKRTNSTRRGSGAPPTRGAGAEPPSSNRVTVPSCRTDFSIITPVVAEDIRFGSTISFPGTTGNSESRCIPGHAWLVSAQIFAMSQVPSRKLVAQELALFGFVFSDCVCQNCVHGSP